VSWVSKRSRCLSVPAGPLWIINVPILIPVFSLNFVPERINLFYFLFFFKKKEKKLILKIFQIKKKKKNQKIKK